MILRNLCGRDIVFICIFVAFYISELCAFMFSASPTLNTKHVVQKLVCLQQLAGGLTIQGFVGFALHNDLHSIKASHLQRSTVALQQISLGYTFHLKAFILQRRATVLLDAACSGGGDTGAPIHRVWAFAHLVSVAYRCQAIYTNITDFYSSSF